LEELGPTFIKIGQVLSTRPDAIPDWAVRELSKLQDDVAPLSYETVRQVVESELGGSLESLFSEFATTPVASASLGQVHRAVLPDGTPVAVKVQRPGIAAQIERDLSVLHDLAELFDGRLGMARHLRLPRLLEQVAQSLRDELVYTIEGRNAERISTVLKPADMVRVPRVFWKLTTARVLTTDMFEARRLRDAADLPLEERSALASRLAGFVMRQVLIEGFFHADPHPGNLFVFPDGALGVVDWGMTGMLSRSMRASLGEIFISIVYQDPERLADEICHLGLVDDEADLDRFRRDLGRALDRYFYLSRRDYPLGQVLQKILELSYEHHIQLPAEVPMLIKVMVTTEGTCMDLDPDYDLRTAFEPIVRELVGAKLEPGQVVRDVTNSLRMVNRMAADLPRQVTGILNRVESGRVVFRSENQALQQSVMSLALVMQRLAMAVVLAGLLVGGSLLYPANHSLGLTGLALGAGGALLLLLGIGRRRF
ncbi:MAG: phosphotransferase, partial [Armatimonadetes bacterium]|nr:phosphotransferase [Armatimonadota bacterium]